MVGKEHGNAPGYQTQASHRVVDHVPVLENVDVLEEETEAEDSESWAGPDKPVFDPEVLLAEVGVETGREEDLGGEDDAVQADSAHVEDVRGDRAEMGAVLVPKFSDVPCILNLNLALSITM